MIPATLTAACVLTATAAWLLRQIDSRDGARLLACAAAVFAWTAVAVTLF